jgi:DNA mismatch endonuclease (patch repair protein)
MVRQNRRDTKPERAIRSELHSRGLRYRLHKKPIPSLRRQADVLFPAAKVAVFVDGCFWHGCPTHGTWPKNNADWWRSKIAANQERDRNTDNELAKAGWLSIRIWEHENASVAADRVAETVRSRLA